MHDVKPQQGSATQHESGNPPLKTLTYVKSTSQRAFA